MKSPEAIRLNITIHPDKDPALFKLIASISKESRTRRLISLAAIGIFTENSNVLIHSPTVELKNSNILDTAQPAVEIEKETRPQSNKQSEPNGVAHEEGELEAIGSFFN